MLEPKGRCPQTASMIGTGTLSQAGEELETLSYAGDDESRLENQPGGIRGDELRITLGTRPYALSRYGLTEDI